MQTKFQACVWTLFQRLRQPKKKFTCYSCWALAGESSVWNMEHYSSTVMLSRYSSHNRYVFNINAFSTVYIYRSFDNFVIGNANLGKNNNLQRTKSLYFLEECVSTPRNTILQRLDAMLLYILIEPKIIPFLKRSEHNQLESPILKFSLFQLREAQIQIFSYDFADTC